MIAAIISELTSLGAAGIIGAMWLTERKLSQKRNRQISQAHKEILQKSEHIECLTNVIKENTAAVSKLNQTQIFQTELIKQLLEELHNEI